MNRESSTNCYLPLAVTSLRTSVMKTTVWKVAHCWLYSQGGSTSLNVFRRTSGEGNDS